MESWCETSYLNLKQHLYLMAIVERISKNQIDYWYTTDTANNTDRCAPPRWKPMDAQYMQNADLFCR